MFHFKQFSVDQTGCAMKINTDGVLLGALADTEHTADILDIGTGTGVIALMMAQRFTMANIDAVEIDESAAQTAMANFAASPFTDRLNMHASSFERFFEDNPEKKYDLIVSNPPFYINSLKSTGVGKQLAKHADADLFDKMLSGVSAHLQLHGVFWLVLPIDTAVLVKQQAWQYSLNLQQIINIRSYPGSEPHRELLVFGLTETKIQQSNFVIYDAPKQYTGQYRTALQQFFTIFP